MDMPTIIFLDGLHGLFLYHVRLIKNVGGNIYLMTKVLCHFPGLPFRKCQL